MTQMIKLPSFFTVIRSVGRVTFIEIIRDKVLYNVIVCGVLLLGIAFLAGRLSFISPERIILDFGLAAVSVTSCVLGVLIGASLLTREIERRTVHVALSHPISKAQFLMGKFFGLTLVIAINWVLLSCAYLLILTLVAGNVAVVSKTLLWALFFGLLQSWMLSSITVLFSTFSTTSLSVMISLGFYLIGQNISQLKFAAAKVTSPFGVGALKTLTWILPNFEILNLGTQATYHLPVTWNFVVLGVLYCIFVIGFLLGFAGYFFQCREV